MPGDSRAQEEVDYSPGSVERELDHWPPPTPATAWVATGAGLGAVMPGGSWLTPPWAS
jgi:hypothetical protein